MLILLAALAMTSQLEKKGDIAFHAGACQYYLAKAKYEAKVNQATAVDDNYSKGFLDFMFQKGAKYSFQKALEGHNDKDYCITYFNKLLK